MARVIALAALAGCSFDPGAGPDSGQLAQDAEGDAIRIGMHAPRWTVVETLTVDTANAAPTRSQFVLESGVTYHLRVSGTITNVIDAFDGDADYYDFASPKDFGCCEDIGLGIDDFVVDDKVTLPNWGPYNATHVYEVDWAGKGAVIAALFQDTYYGNNIGNLKLEILAFQ